MINRKVFFSAPKRGHMGNGTYKGTIIDKVIVPKKIYEHKETALHSSYNPVYKTTVEVNAYLIEDDEQKRIHTIYPQDILKFVEQ